MKYPNLLETGGDKKKERGGTQKWVLARIFCKKNVVNYCKFEKNTYLCGKVIRTIQFIHRKYYAEHRFY